MKDFTKSIKSLLLLIIVLWCCPHCKEGTDISEKTTTMKQTSSYAVHKTETIARNDQLFDDNIWSAANTLTDFHLYWRDEKPLPTTFQAIHDEVNLYLRYEATDPLIQSKLDTLKQTEAVYSDRVEIFFKQPHDSLPYYSLEMDCFGRLYDSEGVFGEYINGDWQWPADGLKIQTNIHEEGYILIATISKATLNSLALIVDDRILAGVYRADYYTNLEGKRQAKWISWIDPKTPKPNFHIGSSFGALILK